MTPSDAYRLRVRGKRREGGEVVPYRVRSESFRVRPWSGLEVDDLHLEPDNRVSFQVGPRSSYTVSDDGDLSDVETSGVAGTFEAEVGPIDYPDSYESPARFICDVRTGYADPDATSDPAGLEWFCFTCSFRPWRDVGDARSAELTFVRPNGPARTVGAVRAGPRRPRDDPGAPRSGRSVRQAASRR